MSSKKPLLSEKEPSPRPDHKVVQKLTDGSRPPKTPRFNKEIGDDGQPRKPKR
mgnify:CR=1 FL=1